MEAFSGHLLVAWLVQLLGVGIFPASEGQRCPSPKSPACCPKSSDGPSERTPASKGATILVSRGPKRGVFLRFDHTRTHLSSSSLLCLFSCLDDWKLYSHQILLPLENKIASYARRVYAQPRCSPASGEFQEFLEDNFRGEKNWSSCASLLFQEVIIDWHIFLSVESRDIRSSGWHNQGWHGWLHTQRIHKVELFLDATWHESSNLDGTRFCGVVVQQQHLKPRFAANKETRLEHISKHHNCSRGELHNKEIIIKFNTFTHLPFYYHSGPELKILLEIWWSHIPHASWGSSSFLEFPDVSRSLRKKIIFF